MSAGWRSFDAREEAGHGNALWLCERDGGTPRLATCDADGTWAFDGTVGVYASGYVPGLCHDVDPPPPPHEGHGALRSALARALGAVELRPVPIGLAVGTGFAADDGDRLGFYVSGPAGDGTWTVLDDGLTVPDLVACGSVPEDFVPATHPGPLAGVLASNGAAFDPDRMEISVGPVDADGVGAAALRMVSILLQVQGLLRAARAVRP